MAKANRECFTCGTKYSYCPDCYDDRHLESWHIMFHDENCKNVFDIINSHFYKHITTEETISKLENCDLSVAFNDDIKKEIDNILAQKVVKTKPAEEPVVKFKK